MKIAAVISMMLAATACSQVDRKSLESASTEVMQQGLYPGLSIAILDNEKLIYAEQFGYADLNRQTAPQQDTLFRMYSVSKGLTQILAAVLVDEGSLDLSSPISRYVPDLPQRLGEITSDQLLNHTSGIRHYSGNDEWLELSQLHCTKPTDAFSAFTSDPLLFEPGTKESYSSFGYVLLSAVLEKAGGVPFGELLEQKVFLPSGARNIHLDGASTGTGEIPSSTTFYERREGSEGQFDVALAVDNSCKFGAGAISGTPVEISRVFSAFYAGKLTSQPTLDRFVPGIADRSEYILSYGGEGLGGRSVVVAAPARNVVITIAANARGGSLDALGRNIIEQVSGKRPDPALP